MKNIFDILSADVPGGITVYLFALFFILFVLFYLYRTSELFTRSHFTKWLLGGWLLATLIYAYLWVTYPSPALLKRYSVFITASETRDQWLAKYCSEEISRRIKPFRDKNTYFFPQRWSYLAGIEMDSAKAEQICRQVVIRRAMLGNIGREGNKIYLKLRFMKYPEEEIVEASKIVIDPDQPEAQLSELFDRLKPFLPFRENAPSQTIANKFFIQARDEFFKGNYEESNRLIKQVQVQFPDNPEIKKWYYYSLIRRAGMLRPQEARNPFETKKMPWQIMLGEARSYLKDLVRQNIEKNVTDDFLNNMLAESYLWEEDYDEAEVFLTNAYAENPFSVYVLENFSHLHASRYNDLGFKDQQEIYKRIVSICPIYADVLIKYVEKLLRITPVHGIASGKAKELVEKFLSVNPNSATSWLLLGEYYHANLEQEKAFQAFSTADSLQPNNTLVQYNLGIMYYLDEDYQNAEAHFKKAIETGDYLDAHLYLGSVYLKKEEYKKALKQFRYRVEHKKGEDDTYAQEAMKGIRQCLAALNIPIPQQEQ